MKKYFLLLMACCLSLAMSAKVAYLLPNGCAYNGPSGDDANISGLASENMDGVNQDPEWRAAQWFYDEYVKTGKGEFISISETDTKYAEFAAIWIHLDRDGRSGIKDYYNDAFIAKLRTYCANGGNLLLTKHATQLLGDGQLNRIYVKNGDADPYPISPEYPNSGWKYDGGEVKWFTSTNFHGFDNSNHALYKDMSGGFSGDQKNVETLLVAGGKNHTDNNCGIPCDWILIKEEDNYEKRLDKINAFNSLNDCRIIGTWGNEGWMQYAGNIEFYPHGENFKGSIIMIGLAAYSWCANNFGYAYENVQKMTRNGINYLSNTPNGKNGGETETKMSDIFLGDWCYPASLATENHSFRTIHPNVSGWNTNNWIAGDQTEIADIMYINDADKLVFKKEGTVTLHTTITEDRELQAWPKGTYEYTHDVTFTYSSSAQAVVDADLSSNGLEGESGKFMLLHPNMRGLDSLEYEISFDGIEEANRAEVEKIKDDGATRLVFTKAGTVKLNIRLNEPNFREEWAKGEHNVTKTVTFAQPAFTWTHTPDVAAINEDKDPVVVTCDNVPGATVKYESSDPTIAAVNETTGKISYIKEGTCKINAYIEINGVKFESDKRDAIVNGLNITWTTAPAETAKVGEEMTIAAAPQYGSATILYETVNCSYADGKLTFSHVGTATVRPYAVVNEHEYTGDTKTITVAAPVVSWAKDDEDHDMVPEDAAILEENYKRTPKAVCDVPGLTVKYRSAAPTKISIDENTGALQYLAPTEGDGIDITAYVTVGETEYSISHKTKCLKPIVEWKTAPTATAVVGQDVVYAAQVKYGDATIGYDYTNCSDVEGKLHFGHAGSASIRPYAEAYGEKYYTEVTGDEITITVAPDLKWVAGNPMSACVGETGKTAIATTTDGTIVYSSSDDTKVSVDSEGNLTFHAYETACKVKIYATVTIGETPYRISGEIDANLPYVYWVDDKKPGETYRKDETPAAEAKLQYGPGVVNYEVSNCSWAADKLTFTAEGEATVQPYVEYESKKYYGEKVTINVTASDTVYTRTVTPNKYGTICLERTSTALEGATFYWPAYKDKASGAVDYIVLEAVDTLRAGQGYFFYATSSEIKVTMSLNEPALTTPLQHGVGGVNTRGMHGNFGPSNMYVPNYESGDPNEYILLNNELRYGSDNYIGEHRAYLKMSEVPVPTAQVPGRRYVTMVVNNPNTTTGLEDTMHYAPCTKHLINGQIYIMRGGRLYTTDGKLVK